MRRCLPSHSTADYAVSQGEVTGKMLCKVDKEDLEVDDARALCAYPKPLLVTRLSLNEYLPTFAPPAYCDAATWRRYKSAARHVAQARVRRAQ